MELVKSTSHPLIALDIYGFRQNKQQIPKDYKRFPDAPDPLPILGMPNLVSLVHMF